MYPGYNASKAIHEARVRELLEQSHDEHPSLFARLRNRLVTLGERRPPLANLKAAPRPSKSLEQTS